MNTLASNVRLPRSIFICALTLGSMASIAATVNTNKCEEEWKQVLDDRQFSDIQSKIKHWESLAPRCAHSGLYEFRLGNLYTQAKQLEKAKALIKEGLAYKTEHDGELRLGMGDIYLFANDINGAEKEYKAVVQKYPDWFAGYQKLGTVAIARLKFNEAIKWMEEANKKQRHAFTYRELTIAHHQLNQHEQAIKALNAAFELDQNLIVKDRDAMLSGAISYTKIGKYKVANGIIGMLLEARPDLRSDAEVVRIQSFVAKKLKE